MSLALVTARHAPVCLRFVGWETHGPDGSGGMRWEKDGCSPTAWGARALLPVAPGGGVTPSGLRWCPWVADAPSGTAGEQSQDKEPRGGCEEEGTAVSLLNSASERGPGRRVSPRGWGHRCRDGGGGGEGPQCPGWRPSPRSPARWGCRWLGMKSIQPPPLSWWHPRGAGDDGAAAGAPRESSQHPSVRAEGTAEPLAQGRGAGGDRPCSPPGPPSPARGDRGRCGLGLGLPGSVPGGCKPQFAAPVPLVTAP